jgi:hypothetical protein
VFIVISVYFIIDSVRKLLDTPSYVTETILSHRRTAVIVLHVYLVLDSVRCITNIGRECPKIRENQEELPQGTISKDGNANLSGGNGSVIQNTVIRRCLSLCLTK